MESVNGEQHKTFPKGEQEVSWGRSAVLPEATTFITQLPLLEVPALPREKINIR